MSKKWFNNGTRESIFEVDQAPTDWVLGRLPFSESTRLKSSESAKKRGPNNKGKKLSKQARENMSRSKKLFFANNPNWVSPSAFQPGRIPWNKNLTKSDDERVARSAKNLSEARTGLKLDEITK